jgi:hypothetical protein
MSSEVKRILLLGLENTMGFKFMSLLLATILLAVSKIDANMWVNIVFAVTGMRAATDIAGIVKPAPVTNVVNQVAEEPKSEGEKS